ncbi:hypothetical protein GCM10018963_54160 [Saccharothrix longispora]
MCLFPEVGYRLAWDEPTAGLTGDARGLSDGEGIARPAPKSPAEPVVTPVARGLGVESALGVEPGASTLSARTGQPQWQCGRGGVLPVRCRAPRQRGTPAPRQRVAGTFRDECRVAPTPPPAGGRSGVGDVPPDLPSAPRHVTARGVTQRCGMVR